MKAAENEELVYVNRHSNGGEQANRQRDRDEPQPGSPSEFEASGNIRDGCIHGLVSHASRRCGGGSTPPPTPIATRRSV